MARVTITLFDKLRDAFVFPLPNLLKLWFTWLSPRFRSGGDWCGTTRLRLETGTEFVSLVRVASFEANLECKMRGGCRKFLKVSSYWRRSLPASSLHAFCTLVCAAVVAKWRWMSDDGGLCEELFRFFALFLTLCWFFDKFCLIWLLWRAFWFKFWPRRYPCAFWGSSEEFSSD